MDLVTGISCWYLGVAVACGAYQGFRGAVETRLYNQDKKWEPWQKVVVLDIHDFVFRFVCTLAGFMALFVAYRIAITAHDLAQISTGSATLLVLSFLIGVIGVGGQLHYVVLLGKLPR